MRVVVLAVCAIVAGLAAGIPPQVSLQEHRSSPQDLEVSGDVPGIPAGATRYLSYAELSQLPQVTYTVRGDDNFPQPARLTGVSLDVLLQALNVPNSGKQLIAAIGSDGYNGHYTAEYRAEHHPFLVLQIEGKPPTQWPKATDGVSYRPYLISQPNFVPAFHVLAHADQPQIPYGVTGLRFYDEDAVFAALRPKGVPPHSPALLAERIVVQNCLRCHNAGMIGGTKSPFGFPQLAMIAKGNPEAFGKYVKRPNSVNPEATMPPNPEYDAATIAALTAYFQSMAK